MTQDGSPFSCKTCSEQDKKARNCRNLLDLTEEAVALWGFTDEVREEHHKKGAEKVFSLSGLRLYECPISYINDETRDMQRVIFLISETGRLLHPGDWGAQPYWLVEAFEISRIERARFIKDKADERKR